MTTDILRPASTIRVSGSIVHPSGTIHAALADNSDATYTECVPGVLSRVRFASLSVAAGAIVQHVTLRLRIKRAGSPSILAAGLAQHTGILFTPTTAFVTASSAPQAGFTPADVAFGISLEWVSTGAPEVDLAAAYLDVVSIPVPTVNVTAPAGTIAVTQPQVTWETTGDFPQERFHLKVFSSAQYGGVGFNPDTSGALFDSGVQIGSVEELTPTVNLPNSDSYRFYVRAAQKVGSVTQWSAWDFTTATVAVTPPQVPTLTVEAQPEHARLKLTADGTGSPTWEFVNIERTVDGTNWTRVRSADRRPVSGVTFIVYDYETGNGQQAQYRAQAVIGDPAGDIASAWSAVTGVAAWTSTATWLKSLTLPPASTTVFIEDLPTVKRRLPSAVFDVAGRRDPIVRTDIRHTVEGTVTFAALDTTAHDALRTLLDRSEVLLLQTPAGTGWGSKYVAFGDEDENRVGPGSRPERTIVLPFIEVAAPVGDVVTFGTTWEEVVNIYATWTALQTAHASWAQLVNADF